MKRILLIGKHGQLGWELHRSLATLGELTAVDYPEIDLQDRESCRELIRKIQPDVVVNAAAYTAVDLAETEQEKVLAINAIAPGLLADEARRLNAIFLHYSTDYVFDGQKGTTYNETDTPNPVNHYGRSKLEGERFIQSVGGDYIILRTSWVYSLLQKGGFVSKVLQWSRQQEKLQIVDDQIANPTWSRLLAEITSQLIASDGENIREHPGIYHLAGGGFTSRFEWAQAVLELDPRRSEQVIREILPAKTADFPTPATRPLFSAMNCELFTETFHLKLPPWKDSLKLAMAS
jgi:dTDP-4-dehydrorhamnose reductase